jgi:hypothetical protein
MTLQLHPPQKLVDRYIVNARQMIMKEWRLAACLIIQTLDRVH